MLKVDKESILDCQSGIGRADGTVILVLIPNPNLILCSLFVLRPAEWRQTWSLWLRTLFVIWRQMWGDARGLFVRALQWNFRQGLRIKKILARHKKWDFRELKFFSIFSGGIHLKIDETAKVAQAWTCKWKKHFFVLTTCWFDCVENCLLSRNSALLDRI